jgi:hypothetical protein
VSARCWQLALQMARRGHAGRRARAYCQG